MIYTVILLVLADFFLIVATIPDVFHGYTIYPFVLNFDALKFQLACLIIPISIIVIFILSFALRMQQVLHPLIVGALLAANAIACCARFTGLALEDKEQASIRFENHIYNVISSEQYFGPGDARWVTLYECDNRNFLCQIIQHQYVLSTKATLVSDPATNTITLQIDGEAVYVHQVK
jgi:hypothetical protein